MKGKYMRVVLSIKKYFMVVMMLVLLIPSFVSGEEKGAYKSVDKNSL